jgi:hypothetical protein
MSRKRFILPLLAPLSLSSFLPCALAGEEFVQESVLREGVNDPAAIFQKEVEWAQDSMELYRRKKQGVPLRSPIVESARNVHTSEWVTDSIHFLHDDETSESLADKENGSVPIGAAKSLRGK